MRQERRVPGNMVRRLRREARVREGERGGKQVLGVLRAVLSSSAERPGRVADHVAFGGRSRARGRGRARGMITCVVFEVNRILIRFSRVPETLDTEHFDTRTRRTASHGAVAWRCAGGGATTSSFWLCTATRSTTLSPPRPGQTMPTVCFHSASCSTLCPPALVPA